MELIEPNGIEGALTLATGASAVAYLVGVTKGLGTLPTRALPALATLYAIGWVMALAVAGRIDDHPVALILHGVVLGQAASGAQGWYRAYRPDVLGGDASGDGSPGDAAPEDGALEDGAPSPSAPGSVNR